MNDVKRIERLSDSALDSKHLKFFHKLLISVENDKKVKDKVIRNFTNFEVKMIINNDNANSITNNPIDYPAPIRNDEIRFTDPKGNKAYSLLCYLRNAFAHNRIQVEDGSGQLIFQDEYKKIINMVGKCSFKKLKYLVETILGEHKMTQEEIREYKKKKQKQPTKTNKKNRK